MNDCCPKHPEAEMRVTYIVESPLDALMLDLFGPCYAADMLPFIVTCEECAVVIYDSREEDREDVTHTLN